MKKRIFALILSFLLVISLLPVAALADEEPQLYKVCIDAGTGVFTEQAIFSEGEIYIPAVSFGKYTRYNFHPDINTFLVSGQEFGKAIKRVTVQPDKKSLTVETKRIKLTDCFTVDGILYLPLCQMMPILNADILAVEQGVILISNNGLSMAELLYDFSLNDYAYNMNEEFFGNAGLLAGYYLPGYVFDSVTNFRFDRLDFIADTGQYRDYRDIFSEYLKDDSLYLQAMERHDDPGLLLNIVTSLNSESEKLNDMMDWIEKAEEYNGSFLAEDKLIEFMQDGTKYSDYFDSYDVDILSTTRVIHSDEVGISLAEYMELVDYLYTWFNHVEDHFEMLDAVYDFSSGWDMDNVQRRGAQTVYDLYGSAEWKGMMAELSEKAFEKALDKTSFGSELALYQLTASVSGELWELVIPGDTGDVSSLPLHAGIVNSAVSSAQAGSFRTEETVNDYRLSLLLTMLASRKCFEIMADTADAYGSYAGDYHAKIEKLEAMIQGLYLVAENAPFDAYENFDDFAEKNRKLIDEARLLEVPEPVQPDQVVGADEIVYLDFLAQHPEYLCFALLDVNQDGCMELLVSQDDCIQYYPLFPYELWVWKDGTFQLAYDHIREKLDRIQYSPQYRWIVDRTGGTGGSGGYCFYYLDENLSIQTLDYGTYGDGEHYEYDHWYNGEDVTNDAMKQKWDILREKHTSDSTLQPIQFFYTPSSGLS